MKRGNYKRKSSIVFLGLFIALLVLLGRLFFLQVISYPFFKERAAKQHDHIVRLIPERGTIYDRNRQELAVSLPVSSLYAVPRKIDSGDKEKLASFLAPVLDLDKSFLLERLNKDKYFVWLKRHVSAEEAEVIRKTGVKELGFIEEKRRFYPKGCLASHLMGFTDIDGNGLEGLEFHYDGYLKGSPGWCYTEKDGQRREVPFRRKVLISPRDGYNLVLTIDEVIQHIVEKRLEEGVRRAGAKAGMVVVMVPRTGEILALSNRPTFDPNKVGASDVCARRNRVITDIFEPGSIFKIVTAAAALEQERVNLNKKFYCENGAYRVGSHTLHDHRPYGWLTFPEVIQKSSNIGTVKVAQILGEEDLYYFVKSFGFGSRTGVDLPGEVRGLVRPLEEWSRLSIAAIPMGQEIAVTPLQMACAINVIANGGKLVTPRLMRFIEDKDGRSVNPFQDSTPYRVISEKTAGKLKDILVGVVEEGTGTRARIFGWKIAGKTGTAQKIEPNGGYSHTKFVGSFIGFFPADNPLISIVVMLDEPTPYYYGGVVAAPIFKDIAADILGYLQLKTEL